MLLSTNDIARLEKKGYQKKSFIRIDKAGYAVLRNRQGSCVFYEFENRRCKVYDARPLGCRIYPVIFDEDKGIVADSICKARETVTKGEKARRGKKVTKLLERLDREAAQRVLGNCERF